MKITTMTLIWNVNGLAWIVINLHDKSSGPNTAVNCHGIICWIISFNVDIDITEATVTATKWLSNLSQIIKCIWKSSVIEMISAVGAKPLICDQRTNAFQ